MKFFTMRMQRKWEGGDNLSFSMYEVVRVQNRRSPPNREHSVHLRYPLCHIIPTVTPTSQL